MTLTVPRNTDIGLTFPVVSFSAPSMEMAAHFLVLPFLKQKLESGLPYVYSASANCMGLI
jgi:hypothetical protein